MNAVKTRLHQLIDESSNADLLDILTDILEQNDEEGSIWKSLSEDDKKRVLITNSETTDPQKQITHQEMKNRNQQWLK